ncbi:carbohydrate ABC transporter permease [Kineococcus glutinatus]|uniref:Carbohydrate ABC transporter permease n=1 Tax=Kineococcus glutinatus TaxID=1070872 RepID=A0ABP9HMU4_9ACTN
MTAPVTTAAPARVPAPDRARPGGRPWGWTVLGVAILAVMLFPLYWMLNVSLQPGGSAVGTPWFPLEPSFEGYRSAVADQGRNLLTSLVVAAGSVVLSLAVAAPAAYALARFRIRWASWVLFAVLISQMVPGIVVANALYSAYNDLGLLNSVPGLVLADSSHGIPFAILVLRAFMGSVPASVVEAARVDGAGQVRAFVWIVLPMARNALITAALFTFLFTWGDFLFALTLTTTEDVRPITLGLYQYMGAYTNDWGAVMATAVLASLPAVVLLVVAQRYVAAGVTGGSVR